jgi:deoxyribodipyrimidine photo-lyase
VLDDRLLRAAGPFRRRQLLADLAALDRSLRERGGRLLVRRGDPAEIVPAEVARHAATRLHYNADVTPYATERDENVGRALEVDTATPYGGLVHPPGSVLTQQGRVSRVFTPFHRAWAKTPWDPWPTPGDAAVADDEGDALPSPDGDPPRPPGEDGAQQVLQTFLDEAADGYLSSRDDLGRAGTSALSVALRFGTISPRQVIEAVGDADADRTGFVRQLAWRDWYAHLLVEVPTLPDRAIRPEYDDIEWRDDPDGFAAWKAGRTGYPIVDAGMRELARTGTMHNRARMITASFLVKDLLIDWRRGERYFRHVLADGDVSQNVGNWQWVAGTGPDAAPYFRIFNPVTQSRTHDPEGRYLRRWVPELTDLDDDAIHAPWELGPLELAAAGVTLGDTYPHPIVDHASARDRALAAYQRVRT